MVKPQLKGKYVPDKDGKLRHVMKLTDLNMNLPASVSHKRYPPVPGAFSSWYNKIWLWIKNNVL